MTSDSDSVGTLLFGDLFYGLRDAGVKVGASEWLALMEVLSSGIIKPDLSDFYQVARSVLIKHEAQYDIWDQVFAAVFAEGKMPTKVTEDLLSWLDNPIAPPQLSADELRAMEHLPLDKLRELFEQRLDEQKERHDGGNRWVGTGGKSPFGHGGMNPAGVRVGGQGGNRSAIQMAQMRRFADYRKDRVLDTRQLAVALRKLKRLSRKDGEPELDVDGSIDLTCKNAGMLTLSFEPPRENQARVLLLMDVGGSMTPYARMVEALFSAANNQNHWKKFESFFFHNCPYSRVYKSMTHFKTLPTAELLKNRPAETFLIIVGDAAMAPDELLSTNGAIDYNEHNATPGIVWLHRLRSHFTHAVWINPMPRRHWGTYTIGVIGRLFDMFPLSVEGIEEATSHLRKQRTTPAPELHPDLVRSTY